jgi:hypothetical protein
MRFHSRSKVAAFACILFLGLIGSLGLSWKVYAQQPSANLVLYDNFDERFLDPSSVQGLLCGHFSIFIPLGFRRLRGRQNDLAGHHRVQTTSRVTSDETVPL